MAPELRLHDFLSPQFRRDPYPRFAEMRTHGSAVRIKLPLLGKAWLTTTYAAANELIKNKEDFVQDPGNAGRRGYAALVRWLPRLFRVLADNMLVRDEPDHRRLRGLVDKAFQRQSVEALRVRMRTIADDLLDAMARNDEPDLVNEFARPLPLAVICELLGLAPEDRAKFMRWSRGLTTKSPGLALLAAIPGIRRILRYLREQIELCRRNPRPGLISALVEADEAGDKLSESELLSMIFVLLMAGHETTTHLISVGALALLEHPDQKRALMADWSRVATATEELLRYVSPVQFSKPRFAARDMEFHGHGIKRGDMLFAAIGAANADPDQFERPEALDLWRNPNHHLAFGTGIHFCLGFQLARAEAQVAFERLFTRFPDLKLAIPLAEVAWSRNFGLRALRALPVKIVRQSACS